MFVIGIVTVVFTLNECFILWGKKLFHKSCSSQSPAPKAYKWKCLDIIWSEAVMQGEDPKDFDSMKEAVDGFYLAIGHLVHTLKGRETFIYIKSHKKKSWEGKEQENQQQTRIRSVRWLQCTWLLSGALFKVSSAFVVWSILSQDLEIKHEMLLL